MTGLLSPRPTRPLIGVAAILACGSARRMRRVSPQAPVGSPWPPHWRPSPSRLLTASSIRLTRRVPVLEEVPWFGGPTHRMGGTGFRSCSCCSRPS